METQTKFLLVAMIAIVFSTTAVFAWDIYIDKVYESQAHTFDVDGVEARQTASGDIEVYLDGDWYLFDTGLYTGPSGGTITMVEDAYCTSSTLSCTCENGGSCGGH